MPDLRHLPSRYLAFLKLIHVVDPECQKKPDLFYAEDIPNPDDRKQAIKEAKAICRACEMKDECFTYAIESNQRYGIWGATEPHER